MIYMFRCSLWVIKNLTSARQFLSRKLLYRNAHGEPRMPIQPTWRLNCYPGRVWTLISVLVMWTARSLSDASTWQTQIPTKE